MAARRKHTLKLKIEENETEENVQHNNDSSG